MCLDRKRRQRQTRKARTACRKLRHIHQTLPSPAHSLFDALAGAFTGLISFRRVVLLALATILTIGRRTVCNLVQPSGRFGSGSPLQLSLCLLRGAHGPAGDWRMVRWRAGSSTTSSPRAQSTWPVMTRSMNTLATRSSARDAPETRFAPTPSYTAFRWGHKWVVLSVLVRFPFTWRQWSLPLLVALYRSEADNLAAGRRHKTPQHLLRQLCCVRKPLVPTAAELVLAGDGDYNLHQNGQVLLPATRPADPGQQVLPECRVVRASPP